jgi:hypothetical protein
MGGVAVGVAKHLMAVLFELVTGELRVETVCTGGLLKVCRAGGTWAGRPRH